MHFTTTFDVTADFRSNQTLHRRQAFAHQISVSSSQKDKKIELVSGASMWHYLVNLTPKMLMAAWGALERGAVGRQEGVLPLASGPWPC